MPADTTTNLFLSQPGNPPAYGDSLRLFLSRNACSEARCVFAYASLAGISESIGPVLFHQEFASIGKKWILGIHNGITEPAAIESLAGHSNSSVRLFSPTGKMNEAALFGREKFHPKAICLTGGPKSLIIIGSANLTRAAIGSASLNFEAGTQIKTNQRSFETQFRSWFERAWRESIIATPRIIEKYSRIRQSFLSAHKLAAFNLDDVPLDAIGKRAHLWIETGAMSGGDRNQIEFGPTLAQFFVPLVRGTINMRILWKGIMSEDRPLSYKVTQWGTEIWRLSLITSSQGGPSFPDRVICFSRQHDDHGTYFEIELAPPNSQKVANWKMMANRFGTIAMTGTGVGSAREYGTY
jgi:HKD family nuclease